MYEIEKVNRRAEVHKRTAEEGDLNLFYFSLYIYFSFTVYVYIQIKL